MFDVFCYKNIYHFHSVFCNLLLGGDSQTTHPLATANFDTGRNGLRSVCRQQIQIEYWRMAENRRQRPTTTKSHGKIVNILSKAFTIKPAFTDGC